MIELLQLFILNAQVRWFEYRTSADTLYVNLARVNSVRIWEDR